MEYIVYLAPVISVVGILFIIWKSKWINKQEVGIEKMKKISDHISEGAMAFLKSEYKILIIFVACVSILLLFRGLEFKPENLYVLISFIVGAFLSGLSGFIGMRVATKANVRTANAARSSLNKALIVAFNGGSVMGLGVVSLGLLGLATLFIVFNHTLSSTMDMEKILNIITSFSLGASSIALFARVGGGIYTKAADVGADLVGKVEAGIPEDHPLNPATIADNVGDNVGDVAGMGADLFESFVGSIIAAMVLGVTLINIPEIQANFNLGPIVLPLALAGAGIFASILGTFFVRVKENGNPQSALNRGEAVSGIVMLILSFLLIRWLLPEKFSFVDNLGISREVTSLGIYITTLVGLGIGFAIGKITEYYTATGKGPVMNIVKQSRTGAATNIIAGLQIGMQSTAVPIIGLAGAIIISYHFAGLYGIAIAAVAMLANTGIQLAVDAYGPISDNAGGIAQMAELPPEVRAKTDKLDAVGNTTAAIGKGFAIASATLTAIALFSAFMSQARITSIDISQPYIMAGLLVGGMLPYLFSSLAMGAVGRAAQSMIMEVRRQFETIPALSKALAVLKKYNGEPENLTPEEQAIMDDAEGKAEYEKCVAISTKASLKEMILPGLVAVLAPGIVGFIGGAEMLGGMLAGVMASGVLLAIYQSNAGGAWDNAKKMVEEEAIQELGNTGKGSESHKATVVGDTVGDPFKDTSGPSLNILIKLISVVALVLAPSLALHETSTTQKEESQIKNEIVLSENETKSSINFSLKD